MSDPAEKNQAAPEPSKPMAGGSSSTDTSSDDFAASLTQAQPYDENTTSTVSVERDEEGEGESVLKK